MKVGLSDSAEKEYGVKSCQPHTSISSFFGILFALDALKAQMEDAASEELERLKRRIARLEKRKKDIKHRAIEQLYNSMTNLIYFFETTQTFGYRELDKDVQHLLGIGQFLYDLTPANNQAIIDSSSIQFSNYLRELGLRPSIEKNDEKEGLSDKEKNHFIEQFDPRTRITLQRFQSNFARLLAGMLDTNSNEYPDFRLVLAATMQDLVTYKVLNVLPKVYGSKEHILVAAKNALDGARNWSEDLSEGSLHAIETTESKTKIARFSTLTEGDFPDPSSYLGDE